LARDPEATGLLVEGFNHPNGKIHVYPLNLKARAAGRMSVKICRHIRPRIMEGVEFLRGEFLLSGHNSCLLRSQGMKGSFIGIITISFRYKSVADHPSSVN
jgi:hypothetical protein